MVTIAVMAIAVGSAKREPASVLDDPASRYENLLTGVVAMHDGRSAAFCWPTA